MYLHGLSGTRQAAYNIERFMARLRRGGQSEAEFPMRMLRTDGHVALRMEIPGVKPGGVKVEGDIVHITLDPDAKSGDGVRSISLGFDAGRAEFGAG